MTIMVPIELAGKRLLVMGVTNQHSLGWAIAERLHAAGAELAFAYQGDRLQATLEKLTAGFEPAPLLVPCDVTSDEQLDALFTALAERWDGFDGLVHAVAFAPREAMEGRYIETRRADWLAALEISAYSLVAVAQRAAPRLRPGAGIVTLTYYAAEKVVPKYNVMAIAKSALEARVRYLADDLGPQSVRVNAISAGPVKTVAARSIPGFLKMAQEVEAKAPLGRNITHAEVGSLGLFLLSDLASGITGETVYVDAGYHVMAMRLSDD